MESTEILELALELAKKGGERMRLGMAHHSEVKVLSKGVDDLVTEIDLAIEKDIVKAVSSQFPNHSIVGEEGVFSEDTTQADIRNLLDDEYCWVVDPLDGTANFANQIPHCCVSIGILKKGELFAGVVYDPFRDELYRAQKGQGAFMNDQPIRCSDKTQLANAIIGLGFPTDVKSNWDSYKSLYEKAVLNFHKVRLLGSTALELCWSATGRIDGFVQYHAKAWDLAAGAIIAKEAGGIVENFSEQDEFDVLGQSVVSSSTKLQPQLKKLLELNTI